MLTRLKEEVAKAQRNEERMWGMMLQRNKEQQAAVKAIVDGAGAMTELCEFKSCVSVDAERLG